MQKTNPTKKFILVAIFVLAIVFGVGKGEKANAETYTCVCNIPTGRRTPERGTCDGTKDECDQQCESRCNDFYEGENGGFAVSDADKIDLEKANADYRAQQNAEAIKNTPVIGPKNEDACSVSEWGSHPFNCMSLSLLNVITIFMAMAVSIFGWIMKPENIKIVIDNDAIYKAWGAVRDVLNVSFIMFLLFSAFATVFQIEKYSYKKTLLMIVIMALLVNFSYPIARFIIDLSNMMMFYFADAVGLSGVKTMVGFASDAELPGIIHNNIGTADMKYILIAVIFTFVFAVTILIISVLFVIRTIALALLIIFSSLAFVGAAITPLSSYANDWWKKIFNYAFFGPIMLFMIYVASTMMKEIAKSGKGSMKIIAADQTTDPSFLASVSFFVIPIIILWMGLGIAQSMSIAGAGAVVGRGQKFMGWAGRTFSGYKYIKPISSAGIKAFDRNVLGKYHLSPRQFIHGWKESTKEAEESKLAEGKGVWHDRLNNIFSLGKQKTNYAEIARQSLVSKKSKQVKEVSEESAYLLDRLSNSIGSKNPESIAEIKAILRTIYSNNDQDELMDYIKNNIKEKTALGKKLEDMGFNLENSTVSEKNVSMAVVKILEQSLGEKDSEEEINKELLDLGNIAAAKQGIGFAAVRYNSEKKKFERIVGNEDLNGLQGFQTAAKMMTMGEAQNIPKAMHRNNFTDQDKHLNESGKALLRRYASPTAIKHSDRHKPDFYKSICLDDNGEISKQMLQYAAALKNGTADGWDPSLNGGKGGYADGVKNKIQDKDQAFNAAAWTIALQIKAGIPIEKIRTELLPEAGFNKEEIEKIIKMSKGPEEIK